MKIFILLITNLPLVFLIIYLTSFLLIKKKKLLHKILILNTIGLIFFSLPISSIILETVFYPKKNIYENNEKKYSIILVPTAGILFNEEKKIIEPTINSINRIKKTIKYTEKLNLPIVISGGKTIKGYKSEARIVYENLNLKYLVNKKIILEENSINSYETSKNIKKFLNQNNLNKNVILITDLYHFKIMSKTLKKKKINTFIPENIF